MPQNGNGELTSFHINKSSLIKFYKPICQITPHFLPSPTAQGVTPLSSPPAQGAAATASPIGAYIGRCALQHSGYPQKVPVINGGAPQIQRNTPEGGLPSLGLPSLCPFLREPRLEGLENLW